MTKNIQEPLTVAYRRRGEIIKNDVRKVRNVRILRNLTFLSANFYTGIACLAMDDVRRNAALKYRERDEERDELSFRTVCES